MTQKDKQKKKKTRSDRSSPSSDRRFLLLVTPSTRPGWEAARFASLSRVSSRPFCFRHDAATLFTFTQRLQVASPRGGWAVGAPWANQRPFPADSDQTPGNQKLCLFYCVLLLLYFERCDTSLKEFENVLLEQLLDESRLQRLAAGV